MLSYYFFGGYMITDIILTVLGSAWNFLVGLFPSMDFIENIATGYNKICTFFETLIVYPLYIFHIPILVLSFSIFFGYITFLGIEYGAKFLSKYISRFL